MKTLIEVEKNLLDDFEYTTFMQCSNDDEHGAYICVNESIPVFDLDLIKETYSNNGIYKSPMSMDAMWIDHNHKILHLVEFKNVPRLKTNQKKEIRLKMLDTLLLLNGELEVNKLNETNMTLILVRNLGSRDRITYHIMAKANNYTPAYLEYIAKLTGYKVVELIPEDFEKYIEDVTKFNF